MPLIEIQPLVDIIGLALQSVYLEEPNGVSLLLIAEPETAKTSSIFQFHDLDFVSYYDEITQKKLMDEFLPLVKLEQKRTLLIPDLVNCIEKQKSTRQQFLNILKSGIDDTGITQISTYHKQLHHSLAEGLKFNLITAITMGSFRGGTRFTKTLENEMKESGLLSRPIPFSYRYPIDVLKKIMDSIESGKPMGKQVVIPAIEKNKGNKRVFLNSLGLFKQLEIVSMNLGKQYGGSGIRGQTNLQRLAKANAMINKRKEVNQEDIDKILGLARWINFDFNPI